MATLCHADGLWDQIKSAPYLSKQEWQAAHLLVLCQLLIADGIIPNMNSCTVDGLWSQIKGNPPYLSEQEFYEEDLNLLCQLLAGSGGGGGGSTVQVYFTTSPPVAPDNPAKAALWYPPSGGTIKEWNGSAWV